MRPSEQKFMAVSADLTSSAECRRALGEIQAWGGVPDIVWTCAGSLELLYRSKGGLSANTCCIRCCDPRLL